MSSGLCLPDLIESIQFRPGAVFVKKRIANDKGHGEGEERTFEIRALEG